MPSLRSRSSRVSDGTSRRKEAEGDGGGGGSAPNCLRSPGDLKLVGQFVPRTPPQQQNAVIASPDLLYSRRFHLYCHEPAGSVTARADRLDPRQCHHWPKPLPQALKPILLVPQGAKISQTSWLPQFRRAVQPSSARAAAGESDEVQPSSAR